MQLRGLLLPAWRSAGLARLKRLAPGGALGEAAFRVKVRLPEMRWNACSHIGAIAMNTAPRVACPGLPIPDLFPGDMTCPNCSI